MAQVSNEYAMKFKLDKLISYTILIIAVFAAMFPIFWTISTSIKTRVDTFSLPPKFFTFTPTLKNYQSLLQYDGFWRIYGNTILITAFTTLICLVVGSLAAYAFARTQKFRGRSSLEILMIVVRALPGIVIILPLYNLSTYFGLYDKMWALILIYTGFSIPFAIWLMTNFFDQVPIEIEDAARVDGASNIQLFTKVLLPLVAPGLVATGVFVALLSWNEFLIPIIMAGEGSKTLPILVASFISNRTLDWGPMAAAATFALVPIILFTVAIQKYLVVGLSGGAVKE
ncbi:MAG: carbohydrate ABC transporter permease [Candidatus Nanopelagicaceae bacterium]|jgi:ABC-type glycerol-3-phosphate transport system permease component